MGRHDEVRLPRLLTRPAHDPLEDRVDRLSDAGLEAKAIDYVNGHGTATETGDIAESAATCALFGSQTPFSGLKGSLGHTLGACGAIEAWLTLLMMEEGWAAPTRNLEHRDERCAPLHYVVGEGERLAIGHTMTNNFAFGGVNTSLIFARA